jgi:hypothetical protein
MSLSFVLITVFLGARVKGANGRVSAKALPGGNKAARRSEGVGRRLLRVHGVLRAACAAPLAACPPHGHAKPHPEASGPLYDALVQGEHHLCKTSQ